MFGNAHTHDRLIRELAIGADAAVVFPNYSLSPEATYPTAIEESYAVAQWVTQHGAEENLDPARVAIAGDSVGGNMTAALTLLAKQRGDVSFAQQVLFYPVTDASFDTDSYHEFAEGYFVRMTLVAVLALLGHKAWALPRWLDRILPNVDLEGTKLTQERDSATI